MIARTVCEIQFTCGNFNRPILCECVLDFGYPEPLQSTTMDRTFIETCIDICKKSDNHIPNCKKWEEENGKSSGQ